MKKNIFVVIFLLFLTGCDVNYEIKIDENLNVSEKIIFESNDLEKYIEIMGYNSSTELFNEYYSYAQAEATKEGYKVSNESTSNLTKVIFEKSSTFQLLPNSRLREIYPYFDTSCNDTKCSIITTSDKTTEEGDSVYPNYKVRITVPYKVLKQNADEIDLKNNTYIWYYSLGGKRSDIEFIFEKQGKNVIKSNKRNSFISTIIFSIIGLVIFGFISRVIYRIIKNSRPSI